MKCWHPRQQLYLPHYHTGTVNKMFYYHVKITLKGLKYKFFQGLLYRILLNAGWKIEVSKSRYPQCSIHGFVFCWVIDRYLPSTRKTRPTSYSFSQFQEFVVLFFLPIYLFVCFYVFERLRSTAKEKGSGRSTHLLVCSSNIWEQELSLGLRSTWMAGTQALPAASHGVH